MRVKLATGEYLDFDGDIDVMRKIKTFEDVSSSDGDVSFSFDLSRTANNMKLLNPLPDIASKPVYHKIPCSLQNDEGIPVHSGFLVVERLTSVISVSFFSGNSNWFGLLSGPLSDIDFSEFDQTQDVSNIVLSHSATSGVVFQVIDNAGLATRSYRHMKVEDFAAGIYVKTVFKKIFQHHSIKIEGELIDDVAFNSILTVQSGKSQADIEAASTYAGKTTTTTRVVENTDYKILFDTDSVYPYYDGSLDPFDIATSTYTAPYKMVLNIEVILQPSIVDAGYNNRIYLYINGAFTFVDIGLAVGTGGLYNSSTAGSEEFFKLEREITLEQGDTLEIYSDWQQSTGSTQNDVISGSLKIIPKYIYSVFGNAIVPKWTQAKYVSNFMQLFNVVSTYNEKTATLTLNIFEKLKHKEATDLSPYISDVQVDYREFVSTYGKKTLFSYNEIDFEDLRKYNVRNFFDYGVGSVDVDNDFLEDQYNAIELDFASPIDYLNAVFGMSMAKTNILSLNEDTEYEITAVTDSSGVARFALDENNIFLDDLVRITDSNNPNYNGDWVVSDKGTGYIELFGLPFDTDATATVRKLNYDYNDSDTVFLLWNIPFYQVPDISDFPDFKFGPGNRTFAAFGYFSLLNNNKQANIDFKQSLSFGPVVDPLFYQFTILEIYWRQFARVLNDPVKLLTTMNMPLSVYAGLDFLAPVKITTLESTGVYYLNKVTGYRGSHLPASVELIKLP